MDNCQCEECLKSPHESDCAVHNMPAYPNEPCNCNYGIVQRKDLQNDENK